MDSEELSVLHKTGQQRASTEACELSKAGRLAYVYKMPNGRYIATTSDRHMVPGILVETFSYGNRV